MRQGSGWTLGLAKLIQVVQVEWAQGKLGPELNMVSWSFFTTGPTSNPDLRVRVKTRSSSIIIFILIKQFKLDRWSLWSMIKLKLFPNLYSNILYSDKTRGATLRDQNASTCVTSIFPNLQSDWLTKQRRRRRRRRRRWMTLIFILFCFWPSGEKNN